MYVAYRDIKQRETRWKYKELKKNTYKIYIDVALASESIVTKNCIFDVDMKKLASFKMHHQMDSKHNIAVLMKIFPSVNICFFLWKGFKCVFFCFVLLSPVLDM